MPVSVRCRTRGTARATSPVNSAGRALQ
ncbi:hypothetical protein FB470_004300 [Amycolatopsis thermophila]|uniref:Uncharacterized protein n=1 Tax=Amycolatopsis thermophila TaxID=206084 RepID=A0ABU0EYF2_9PSEU|nr:hypothetical protein [Amycolatopsis thermophila]